MIHVTPRHTSFNFHDSLVYSHCSTTSHTGKTHAIAAYKYEALLKPMSFNEILTLSTNSANPPPDESATGVPETSGDPSLTDGDNTGEQTSQPPP